MSTLDLVQVKTAEVKAGELEALTEAIAALPAHSVFTDVLQALVQATERGAGVTTFVEDREFSPNQAAQILGMSRPHLLKFIRSGALDVKMEGTHQRISYSDLMDFKARHDQASKDVAAALAHIPGHGEQVELSDEELAELDQL